jgi:hypothetical protein
MINRHVIPGDWEPYYTFTPVWSIRGQVLDDEQVYRRLKHVNNVELGYEYATILDIAGMVE